MTITFKFEEDKYDYAQVIQDQLSQKSDEELWKLYETSLRSHDWLYLHAGSDPKKQKEGALQKTRIDWLNAKLRLLDPERADRMYADACPWGMS